MKPRREREPLFRLPVGAFFILLIALIGSTQGAAAQSDNAANPTPLTGNTLSGNIAHKDAQSYYYTFTAGPGDITFALSVKSNGNFSYMEMEILDLSKRTLLRMDASSNGAVKKSTLKFDSQQTLLMRLASARTSDGGAFNIKINGLIGAAKPSTQPSTQPPTNANADKPVTKDATPPRIRITSPSVSRGQSASAGTSRVTVIGEAIDESGVSEVLVRGIPARLDANGNFSAEVMLKVGDNEIAVSATDTYGNRADERLLINRGSESPSGGSQAVTEPPKGRYYALLIGIEDYKGPVYNRLDNPLKDAEKLRDVLTTHYTFEKQDVTLLKNPTRDEIIDAIERLEKTLKPEDNLLIFYAGHGQWDKDRQQGYWIPSDVLGDSRSKWLSNGEVRDSIRGIKARHTLLITDACFGGGILSSRGAVMPPSIQELMRLPSRTAMTSGAMTTVPDRSVFLEYLTKRLVENKEPFTTAASIFTSLQTAVIDNSPRMTDGNRTTPLYGSIQEAGHEGGDFIFVRRQ